MKTLNKVISIFPNLDEPVEYCYSDEWLEEEMNESTEYDNTDYQAVTATGRTNSNIMLPQPSSDMCNPLTVEVDPVSCIISIMKLFLKALFYRMHGI